MGWRDAWDDLGEPWQRALSLAWEAMQHGGVAVGAVVLDADGAIVAEGRNRAGTEAPEPGQLGGSLIAHAEVNALGRLPVGTPHPTTLLTTLEPCTLCTAASRFAHIDVVRYLAADPAWAGSERMGELNPLLARRMPSVRERDDRGPWSRFAGGLAHASFALRQAATTDGDALEVLATNPFIAAGEPADIAVAERLVADGLHPDVTVTLPEALDRWWTIVA